MGKLQNKAKTSPARDANGRLKKGQTANPGGRPKIPEDVKEAYRAMHPRALERLKELLESDDERIAIKAVEIIIERVEGKVTQKLEHEAGANLEGILAELEAKGGEK